MTDRKCTQDCFEVAVDTVDDRFGKYVSKKLLGSVSCCFIACYGLIAVFAFQSFYSSPHQTSLEVYSIASTRLEESPSATKAFKRIYTCSTVTIKDDTAASNNVGSITGTVGRFQRGFDPTCEGEPSNEVSKECPSLLFSGPAGRISKSGTHILNFNEATSLSSALYQCANGINTPASCDITETYDFLDLDRSSALKLLTPDGLLGEPISEPGYGITANLGGTNPLVQNLRSAAFYFKTYDTGFWRYEMVFFIDKITTEIQPDNSTRYEYELDFRLCFKTEDNDNQELELCNSFENEEVQCDTSLSFCLPICVSETDCTFPRDIVQRYVRLLFTSGSHDRLLNYIKSSFRNKHFVTCKVSYFDSLFSALANTYGFVGYFTILLPLLFICYCVHCNKKENVESVRVQRTEIDEDEEMQNKPSGFTDNQWKNTVEESSFAPSSANPPNDEDGPPPLKRSAITDAMGMTGNNSSEFDELDILNKAFYKSNSDFGHR